MIKNALMIAGFMYFLYNVVDDKTRAKFDNGVELQNIYITEYKNNIYLYFWEFFGAHREEVDKEKAKMLAEINKRKEKLKESAEILDGKRAPATEEDEAKKYEKFLAK